MSPARYFVLLSLPVFAGSSCVLADDVDAFFGAGGSEQLLAPQFAGLNQVAPPVSRRELDLTGFFGISVREWGLEHFSMPLLMEERRVDAQHSMLLNALSVQWQHSMNARDMMTLSARYGDYSYSDPLLAGGTNTSAMFSWSRLLGDDARVIGKFFVGDESSRDRASSYAGRRYYGLLVEGSYALWPDHAPFASLSWQHSDFDVTDYVAASSALSTRHDSGSRFAAGWNWQVQPNWGVRAEANYRFSDYALDFGEADRTQFYFSTRYGFQ
jgi:hypothetical protein